MAINWSIEQSVDLTRGAQDPQVWPDALLVQGDENAHTWRVAIRIGGKPARITGTVTGYFIRSDDYMVPVEGNLDGHIASVTLNASCYAVEGDMRAVMQIETDGLTLTLAAIILPVRRLLSDSIVDNEHKIPSIAELLAQVEALKKAIADAKSATENAEAQAAAARSAADKAYKSASAADDAAADAILAAGDADDATDAANQAAATANAAAQRVEDAIDGAADAADAANAAAALVDAAIEASEQATQGAQASAAAATQAALEAEEKAALADAAAQGAEASAGEADAAAGRANDAAESIEGLTISETVVDYGEGVSASVEKNPETGAYHIEIQTQRGPKGDPGEDYKILGPAYLTVEELALNVLNPEVGDQYNVGISAPYHVYRWTGSEWEDQGTIQGPAGTDAPQINDDEALSTNPWSGLKTQEEIAKVEGKIYPCTAQALEAMTQEQQAQLFSQGYRAIKTENNGTVVLLGLASDGSLEWLGCNQPRGNLLDNPDFAIAQAGYGGMHGVVAYAADRWPLQNATFTSGEAGKITVTGGDSDGYIYQRFLPPSGPITVGYFDLSENLYLISANDPDVLVEEVTLLASNQNIQVYVNQSTIQVNFVVNAGETVTFSKAFCYSGNYTPKTLPPWEAPDYTLEYLMCRRYYKALNEFGIVAFKPIGELVVVFVASDQMRVVPTAETSDFQLFSDGAIWVPVTVASIAWMGDCYRIRINIEEGVSDRGVYIVRGLTGLSADL